jgi:hypothetical protein
MPFPSSIWERIRARRTRVPQFAEIPSEHVLTPIGGVAPILPQRHYFALVVDELFLANDRQWHREFDPMVLAITEFVHGSSDKLVSLPFVVGPKLLGDNATTVPQGMLYRRTRVAGVHPFRGGRVISTIVLCQVRRLDYSRQLLKCVESVATAIPFAADLSTYVRYAGSLLDGIDALLGVGETTPIVGIRQEFDHDLGFPIRPAYFALVDGAESQFPVERLWVRDGSLLTGDREDKLQPLREASYVLFSTPGVADFTEIDTLPLHATVATTIGLAASPDDVDWKRAKAELVVLLRQLLTSPNFTREQALRYHASIVQQAKEAHEHASSIGTLEAHPGTEMQDEFRQSAALLDLP